MPRWPCASSGYQALHAHTHTIPVSLLCILSLCYATTAFSELKKRSRHAASESFELARSKRYRGLEATPSTEEIAAAEAAKDVPKYTQRHVEFFEQAKQAEIARIRYIMGHLHLKAAFGLYTH